MTFKRGMSGKFKCMLWILAGTLAVLEPATVLAQTGAAQTQAIPSSQGQRSGGDAVRAEAVRQAVTRLGLGSEARIQTENGRRRIGKIRKIYADGFQIGAGAYGTRVKYGEVVWIDDAEALAVLMDATAIRQTVATWGLGKNIELQTAAGRLRGRIHSIRDDGFEIRSGAKPTITDVRYAEVQRIRQYGWRVVDVSILVAAVGGAIVAAFLMCYESGLCSGYS